MAYQTYSTSLKIYYSLGLQKQFVSKEIRTQIPNSTSSAWKKSKYNDIVGSQLEKNIQQHLSEIQLLYHPKAAVPRKLATAQIRLILLVISFFDQKVILKTLRNNKAQLINFLEHFERQVSYKQFGKLLSISSKTLYNWRTQVKYKCDASALLLCAKRHPNQATLSEVNTLKKWLSKQELSHWSIQSIWALAFKKHETNLSKQTWYHYNKLLEIRKSISKGKKKKYDPLLADRVNQIWHADITVFKTIDGMKHYIYTVMDNYSRFIHSWRIESFVSAKTRLETLQEAIRNAFGNKTVEQLQLVTDGGPENDNLTLRDFMRQSTILHTIALRDIVQSNSMMEAFYRTTKYQCLYLRQIENGKHLFKEFENWIHEYNHQKPHHALGIYTPFEVLNGKQKNESFKRRMITAAQKRREMNRNGSCIAKCKE